MNRETVVAFLTLSFVFFGLELLAAPIPPPSGGSGAPIDGFVGLMAIVGAGYGALKYVNKKAEA
jgi:hypothetical protein